MAGDRRPSTSVARHEAIEVTGLNFTIGDAALLRDVVLRVPRNSLVGLIGPNGSGKSTLLKHVYRLYQAESSSIYIGGKDVLEYSNKEFAKKVAVVAQENWLQFDFTVEDIVLLGRYPHKGLIEQYGGQDKCICREALQTVGMAEFAERSFLSLSGGEKQRVFLALAFAQGSEVIVLDEPTNHLDVGYQLLVLDILKGQREKTKFTSLHDINLAARYCDVIYVIDGGRIVAGGSPQEVLCEELLEEVFRIKTKVMRDEESGSLSVSYLAYTGERG